MKHSACFLLTRGYPFKKKHHYLLLIRRNLAARRVLIKTFPILDFLIFHEGNISKFDQFFIKIFSLNLHLRFMDVSKHFKVVDSMVWTGESEFSLGYSFMCRFQYLHIWKYLSEYEWVIRVDEDCVLKSVPRIEDLSVFTVGAVSKESHARTNETLPIFLHSLNVSEFYDHRFPYTNVFITKPSIWLDHSLQIFLETIGNHPYSLENRWGDLPVLGVAAKKYFNWDWKEGIKPGLTYWHRSHGHQVTGEITTLEY